MPLTESDVVLEPRRVDSISVPARVAAIVAHVARKNRADVSPASSWRVLGIDSLDLLEVMLQCEAEFGVSIPDERILGFRIVQDLAAFIDSDQSSP